MGGTTSPYGFPYPTGTDRVMDGDNAMQALAEAVDNHLETNLGAATPTTLLPNSAPWTSSSKYAKRAGIVTFTLYGLKDGWITNEVACYLPPGFRPNPTSANLYFTAFALNTGESTGWAINYQTGAVFAILQVPAGRGGATGTISFSTI